MLRTIQKNIYLKRYFSKFSQPLFKNENFDLETPNDDPSQSVAQTGKRIQNEPFIKSIFAGKYLYDYLKYPEYENNHELSIMNKVLIEPIKKLENKPFSKDAYDLYNNLSLYSSAFPKQYGGLNLNQSTSTYISRLLEEYGANHSTSYGINYIYNNELAAKSISMYGSAEQKSKYLPKISNAEMRAAFCYNEPNNGCDPVRFQTNAVEGKNGNFVINGKKGWVTVMPRLKQDEKNEIVFVVFCKTHDKADKEAASLNAFLVDKNTEGVSMKKKFSESQEFDLYEIEFNNVNVEATSLLGSLGTGFEIATKLIENAYHLVGALCVGILKTALRDTVEFCINTKRFDKSLSEFTIVKERISDIDSRLYAMESMVYMTAGIIDTFEIADISCESALTKIFCTESLKWGLDECLKILATKAYSNEKANIHLEKNINHANILFNILNTNDILRLHVSSKGLMHAGLEIGQDVRKYRNPLMNPLFLFKQVILNHRLSKAASTKSKSPEYFFLWEHVHPSLNELASELEQCAIKIMLAVKSTLITQGRMAIESHYSFRNLSDIAMNIYAMNSVIARSSRAYSIGLKNANHELSLAMLQCYQSKSRAIDAFERIISSRLGMGIENTRINAAEHIFRANGESTIHSLSRNY